LSAFELRFGRLKNMLITLHYRLSQQVKNIPETFFDDISKGIGGHWLD
jgi:hypothetical protein